MDRELEPPIDELVAAHLRACWAVSKKDFVEAYKCQALSVQNFCKLLSSEKDSNWPLPMMYALCLDLRLFALKADDQLSHKGGKPGKNTVQCFKFRKRCKKNREITFHKKNLQKSEF